MTTAYFEMIGGASGNMLLGALLDAGASAEELERALRTIPVRKPWTLHVSRADKRGIAATLVEIIVPGEDGAPDHVHGNHGPHGPHGNHGGQHEHGAAIGLADVLAILDASELSAAQKERAQAIYTRLAEAEARAHGATVETVHFHEIGETDAILDIAGTCVLLDALGIERIASSAFPLGSGHITMQHGTYPNPPPATAELLRGFATYDGGVAAEMVTTTGAAVLTTLATPDTARPAMCAERIGYGAGTSDFAIPNVLRVTIGPETGGAHGDVVAVLETNVDDMPPQYFELALERAFAAGALDAWLAPVTMKKSRPGIVFGVIAPLDREDACAQAMLTETSTLGIRIRHERRVVLERTLESVETPFGPVRVKRATAKGGHARRTLEYDDIVRIAREQNLPVAEVARIVGKIVDVS
jgi:pyridinium-3,5-bisthiocarboxylic acid mononucleotide nickel chelatase